MLEMNKREVGDVVIFAIAGEIDLYIAPEVKSIISKELDAGRKKFIFDFSRVNYIDSSGVGVVFNTYTRLKKIGGSLKIINVGGTVEKLFNISGLANSFEIYRSEQEAIKSFSAE